MEAFDAGREGSMHTGASPAVSAGDPASPALPGSVGPGDRPEGAGRPARPPQPSGHRGLRLALILLQIGPVAILIALIAVLAVLSDVFLSLENIGNVMKQSAVICVLALGQLAVIVTRGIDLSVGSTLSLSAVVGALV